MPNENNTPRVYPPELKVDFDKTEPAGLRKVKEVRKQIKVGNNWQDNPDPSQTKRVAQAVNAVHVVLRYKDAYKDAQTGKFPVSNFGAGPVVNINWRMFIVGPVAVDPEDGMPLTRTQLPVEVSWSDRSTDAWVYDMMTRVINEAMTKNPNTDHRELVFEFGKKAGATPAGAWYFSYAGRLSEMYPNITLPADQPGQGSGQKRERPSGPSAAVLASMPDGAKLPSTSQARQAAAQQGGATFSAQPPQQAPQATQAPRAPASDFAIDLSGTTPAQTGSTEFQPTEAEELIAQVMTDRLAAQGTTLREVCAEKGIDPYVVLFNTFTKGQAKDPLTGNPVTTTPERADIIAKNPRLVGIDL